MKERIIKAAEVVIIVILSLILLGTAVTRRGVSGRRGEEMQTYYVRPGDTLYSIAEAHGVEDWRRWCYDVQRANGMDSCELMPGEGLIIFVKG